MRLPFRKMRSDRGASLVLVLLFLLCATMVSSLVLSAALGGVGALRSQQESRQAYLSVSSAAQVFRDSVLGAGGSYHARWDVLLDAQGREAQRVETLCPEASGPFSREIRMAIEDVLLDGMPYSADYTLEMENHPPVSLCLTLEQTDNAYHGEAQTSVYTLTARFTCVPEAREDTLAAPCCLVVRLYGTGERSVLSLDGRQHWQEIEQRITWDRQPAVIETPKEGAY